MQNNKLGLVPAPEKKKKKQFHTCMQIQVSLNIHCMCNIAQ